MFMYDIAVLINYHDCDRIGKVKKCGDEHSKNYYFQIRY